MSASTFTRVERRGSTAWITLASPANRNTLTVGLVAELAERLASAMSDDAVRVVVLSGEGSVFCAGADLKNRGAMGAESGAEHPLVGILRVLRTGPKPVIAAVNGHAFGGGVGLVAAADIAIAVESAQFSFSEVRLGLIPAMISVAVLPVLGERQTMRLFLTGERFQAPRAVEYGLVHRAVPDGDLEAAVLAEAAEIAKGGPEAVRAVKELVRRVASLPDDDAYAYATAKIAERFASDEASEGMAAFRDKRPPRWIEDV